MKTKGYNRMAISGRRSSKKIQRYGYHKYPTLAERIIAESNALDEYQKRTGVGRYRK